MWQKNSSNFNSFLILRDSLARDYILKVGKAGDCFTLIISLGNLPPHRCTYPTPPTLHPLLAHQYTYHPHTAMPHCQLLANTHVTPISRQSGSHPRAALIFGPIYSQPDNKAGTLVDKAAYFWGDTVLQCEEAGWTSASDMRSSCLPQWLMGAEQLAATWPTPCTPPGHDRPRQLGGGGWVFCV